MRGLLPASLSGVLNRSVPGAGVRTGILAFLPFEGWDGPTGPQRVLWFVEESALVLVWGRTEAILAIMETSGRT